MEVNASVRSSTALEQQSQPKSGTAAAAGSSVNMTSTGAALAIEVPATQLSGDSHGVTLEQQQQQETDMQGVEAGEGEVVESRPASPLNIQSLLNRPFGDVMREIISGFQLKSTAQVSAEQLRYLVFHRDHDRDVLASSQLMAALMQQVREGPGLPVAGSCMAVLAQLGRTAGGRAQLRQEGVLHHVLRYLHTTDVLQRANAEAVLLLLQNVSCDKLCRHAVVKAGGIELLLQLLAASHVVLKQQHPKVAAYLCGVLLNLVSGDDGESSAARHTFVKAGGMEVTCQVLADWGRYDSSPATLRLRLLLADLAKLQQYATKLHQTALDASTHSARSGGGHAAQPESARSSAAGGAIRDPTAATGGRLLTTTASGRSVEVGPDVIAMAGKGIPLGTPRMPASERITAVVLQHGKDNHDAEDSSEGVEQSQTGTTVANLVAISAQPVKAM